MNLYYCQPILLNLAAAFDVDDLGVSRIPILLQAGYASGLILVTPLGDLIRRRSLLLVLIFISGSLTIGLAVTRSLRVFEALSFLTAFASVTPQVSRRLTAHTGILMPFAADLAKDNRRATFTAIVLSGLLLGLLLARVLSGIIAEFSSYSNIYWMGAGCQYLLMLVLYSVTPDTPPKNPDLTYFKILLTMAKFIVTEPALIQGCFIMFFNSAIFSGFWVTMTFLLAGSPYHYSTLIIGLFGLVGMVGIAMTPIAGRLVDGLVPWVAALIGIHLVIVSQFIQTFAGQVSVAAVIIAIIVLDLGVQSTQVAITAGIFNIAPEARARLNALLIFSGQVMGTAVGTKLLEVDSYKLSSGVRVAFGGAELLFLLIRGPHVARKSWLGWQGGMRFKKQKEREDADPVESQVDSK
ncbi:MFS DHA1 protein [Roridomyces roridus]|uniref:MFS DHA1 protein n=1 Tax=Roridomyces roridus TaxID=1738132 RepID=A0AAD7FHU4_9AGAR|nr:MFS DHA1 protein [Roridomyces roridus]